MLPKFLIAENSNLQDVLFVVHTEYPRFVLNVTNDEVEWFDDLDESETELESELTKLVVEAFEFYDSEMEKYEE